MRLRVETSGIPVSAAAAACLCIDLLHLSLPVCHVSVLVDMRLHVCCLGVCHLSEVRAGRPL